VAEGRMTEEEAKKLLGDKARHSLPQGGKSDGQTKLKAFTRDKDGKIIPK